MKIIWTFSIIMLVIGVIAHMTSFILEKKYKNKMNSIADNIKSQK